MMVRERGICIAVADDGERLTEFIGDFYCCS